VGDHDVDGEPIELFVLTIYELWTPALSAADMSTTCLAKAIAAWH
jgi:hypothetical protein